jgi:hypothetical protein
MKVGIIVEGRSVLTLYAPEETSLLPHPKERLWRILNKQLSAKEKNKIFALESDKFEQYKALTQDFRKIKRLKKAMEQNKSLALFCADLLPFQPVVTSFKKTI